MRTELSFPPFGTDIPYWEVGDDPAFKHEYIDLRAEPGRVAELPEVRRAAQWEKALLAINGPGTIFRTFGCDFVIDRGDFGAGLTHLAHSYVHVGFADWPRCHSADDYYRLFGRLAAALHAGGAFEADDGDEERYYLDFRIEALRVEGSDRGSVANLSCDVLGASEDNARAAWGRLLESIASFLAAERLGPAPDAPP